MDPAHALAERSVDAIWRENYRYGLIDATPMRPGRGRRASHFKGQRGEGRVGQERFRDVVRSVEAGLRSGLLSPESARRQIHEADLGGYIRITETRQEVVEAFALFYGMGYYLWGADGEPNGSGVSLLRVSFATRKELT
ncbi:MAG: hypothetical protein LC745_09105 [Planctomycetia bacterium]|nr:hypothetical protein [Planctomycetia bacterium]